MLESSRAHIPDARSAGLIVYLAATLYADKSCRGPMGWVGPAGQGGGA